MTKKLVSEYKIAIPYKSQRETLDISMEVYTTPDKIVDIDTYSYSDNEADNVSMRAAIKAGEVQIVLITVVARFGSLVEDDTVGSCPVRVSHYKADVRQMVRDLEIDISAIYELSQRMRNFSIEIEDFANITNDDQARALNYELTNA